MTIDTTNALTSLPGPGPMLQGEADILELMRAIKNDPKGGAALARIRDDMEGIIRAAKFPELVPVYGIDDDYEPDEDGYRTVTLRCPTCGGDADEGGLVAVDSADRWTYPGEIEVSGAESEGGTITFDFDGDAEFGDTLYFLHEAGKPHAVALPEGWEVENR